jgi:hypothetical protein
MPLWQSHKPLSPWLPGLPWLSRFGPERGRQTLLDGLLLRVPMQPHSVRVQPCNQLIDAFHFHLLSE